MNRSRRRASRILIAVLILGITVAVISVLRKSAHQTIAAKPADAPPLSVVQPAAVADAPQTQPATPPVAQTPPPIETVTPDSLASTAQPASMTVQPATRPAVERAVATATPATQPASWSRLLSTGSSDGSAPPPTTQPIVTGNGPLADAAARKAAGQLIDARAVLNDALQSGQLNDTDTSAARALASELNQTLVFSPKAYANDPYAGVYLVKPGDSLAKIAVAFDTTWDLLAQIDKLDPKRLRAGSSIKIIRGPFFAVVRKKAFAMDVYLGALPGDKSSMYVTTYSVGLGKDDSTPTGTWAIMAHAKLKHPTYYPPEGGAKIEADDPANPLGGYWIGLTGVDGQAVGRTSYGIHGTIDPDSIGKQASMGCIRLRAADIAMVFELMVEGKSVVRVE